MSASSARDFLFFNFFNGILPKPLNKRKAIYKKSKGKVAKVVFMKMGTVLLALVVLGLVVAGCSSNSAPPSGYASYGGQQGQQQYVGGGCGVAPSAPEDAAISADAIAAPPA